MGFIDDLSKASAVLQKGVDDFVEGREKLAQQRLLQEAQSQIDFIKNSEDTEFKKQTQLKDLAQNFANQFLQAGGTAAQTKMVEQLIKPEEQPFFQTSEQAAIDFIVNDPELDRQQKQEKIFELVTQKQELKQQDKKEQTSRENLKLERGIVKDFFASKPVQEAQKSLGQAKKLEALLTKDKNEPVDNARFSVAIRAFLKAGGEERISDQDVKGVDPTPAFADQFKNFLSKGLKGVPIEKQSEILRKAGRIMASAAKREMKELATGFIKAEKGNLEAIGSDPDRIQKQLFDRLALKEDSVQEGGTTLTDQIKNFPRAERQKILKAATDAGVSSQKVGQLLRGELSEEETKNILRRIKESRK